MNKTITVVDCKDFTENTANNYKEVPIDEAIPNEPERGYSRYEVLDHSIRRMYFDFDGIEDVPENESLPDEFVKDYVVWMNSIQQVFPPNVNYVKTTNHASTAHKGFSSHVIIWRYSMSTTELKNSLILFFNTPEGERYEKYVDLVVYSSLRLFKLPHFIGIPMTNMDNYHRLDPRDQDPSHYIIQDIEDCKQIQFRVKVPRKLKRKAKKNIISPTNAIFYAQLATAKEEFRKMILEQKQSRSYDKDGLGIQLQELIDNPIISEKDKERIRRYIPPEDNKLPVISGLIHAIKNKYQI